MQANTSVIAKALKKTLNKIVTDKTFKGNDLILSDIFKVETQMDNWEEDQEYGGLGLATEKPEGQALSIKGISPGNTFRYIAKTYGVSMVVTQEAFEDNKYPMAIKAAQRCERAIYKTAEIDAALMFSRGFNTAYTFGTDAKPLWSATHTLPKGGTFSNLFATPLSPSVAAVSVARTQARKMPGHDGITDRLTLKKVVCPAEQESDWEVILGSKLDTDTATNHARINIANRMKLGYVVNEYWDTTETNYFFITSAENGLSFRWRRKPQGNSWDENNQQTVKFSCSARWSRGHSDPRCTIGVNA